MRHPLVTVTASEASKMARLYISHLRGKTQCVESVIRDIESAAKRGQFKTHYNIRTDTGGDNFPNRYSASPIAKILRRDGYRVCIRYYSNTGNSNIGTMYIYWGWKFRPLVALEQFILWLTFRY